MGSCFSDIDTINSGRGQICLDGMVNRFLHQIVTEPTRDGAVLDLFSIQVADQKEGAC